MENVSKYNMRSLSFAASELYNYRKRFRLEVSIVMESTPKKIMKVEHSKDYKKPLYACALAAAIAVSSVALTGCEDPMDKINDLFTGGLVQYSE